jgi:hypothetical protein
VTGDAGKGAGSVREQFRPSLRTPGKLGFTHVTWALIPGKKTPHLSVVARTTIRRETEMHRYVVKEKIEVRSRRVR